MQVAHLVECVCIESLLQQHRLKSSLGPSLLVIPILSTLPFLSVYYHYHTKQKKNMLLLGSDLI